MADRRGISVNYLSQVIADEIRRAGGPRIVVPPEYAPQPTDREDHAVETATYGMLATHATRVVMVRLNDGSDLLQAVKDACLREGIQSGYFTALGALTHVIFAVYSLEQQKYIDLELNGYYEFTSVVGNICTVVDDDGRPVDLFVHAHINFSGHDGAVFGGHLRPGMQCVALGEIHITEIAGTMKRLKSELDRRGYSPLRFG